MANSILISEFSREQRELPRQPNLVKNKAKLHIVLLCTRYRDIYHLNNRVFGVSKFKYAIVTFKGSKGPELPWQANMAKK